MNACFGIQTLRVFSRQIIYYLKLGFKGAVAFGMSIARMVIDVTGFITSSDIVFNPFLSVVILVNETVFLNF